jgi:hypothetical protein
MNPEKWYKCCIYGHVLYLFVIIKNILKKNMLSMKHMILFSTFEILYKVLKLFKCHNY